MGMMSLLAKAGVTGAVVTCSYGTVEDVVKGMMDGVSVNAAWTEMRMIHSKLMEFYSSNGRYPLTQNEMIVFFKEEFDTDPKVVLTDPWDTHYNIFTPKYEVHSSGPDTQPRTNDDMGIDYPDNVNRPF